MSLCNKFLIDKKLKESFSASIYDYGVSTNQSVNNLINYLAQCFIDFKNKYKNYFN